MAFVTLLALRHLTQIYIYLLPLGVTILMCRIFGLNMRWDVPRIFLPAPPLFLAIPLRLIRRPITGFLPHMEHILGIVSKVYSKLYFCQEK
jgi:hypothetical protein